MKRSCILLAGTLMLLSFDLLAAPPTRDQAIVRIAATHGNSVEQGTGFLVSADGLVATAFHVVQGASRVDVYGHGEFYEDVNIVAVWPATDLAFVRIPVPAGTAFYPLPASPTAGAPGDALYVQGLPLGFPLQMLAGRRTQSGYLVSQLWTDDSQLSIFNVTELDLLPLDITAEPGMSGGPVVDEAGNIVAVFSGSLRRGRGYAWGIPVDYLQMDRMEQFDRRAAEIDWPQFSFLREGLTFLRTRAASGTPQLWQRCRQNANTFAHEWEAFASATLRMHGALFTTQPVLASVRNNLSPQNASMYKARVQGAFELLLPYLEDLAGPAQTYPDALGDTYAICFGEGVFRALPAENTPATYENVLTSARLVQRMEELTQRFNDVQRDYVSVERRTTPILERLFEGIGVMNQDHGDYEQMVLLLDVFDSLNEIAEVANSPENLRIMGNLIDAGIDMSEWLQRASVQNWDDEHRTYEQSRSGFEVQFHDGWLPLDPQLRDAVFRRDVGPQVYPGAINFGTIEDYSPRAFADIGVEYILTPSANAPDSEIGRLWQLLDIGIRSLAQREGFLLEGLTTSRAEVSGDLVLEATATSRLPDNREVAVYTGLRFRNGIAVRIDCVLLERPWDEHRLCTKLTDNIRFAN